MYIINFPSKLSNTKLFDLQQALISKFLFFAKRIVSSVVETDCFFVQAHFSVLKVLLKLKQYSNRFPVCLSHFSQIRLHLVTRASVERLKLGIPTHAMNYIPTC